ncbi:flagellar basal-body rod protein FlgF [Synergistaceae bacterium OttesenSCG-928-I11]|nr:flagellar basal-body rod protein FlgF [Synergistaceae bacterium OttesenSCG-928-I11]
MFRGIYAATSAMLVQEKMLDVVGNNLANVDTSGFRARVAVNQSFPEVLMDRVERYTVLDEELNEELGDKKFFPYVRGRTHLGTMPLANVMSGTYMSTRPGNVTYTDNPLDIMIEGEGFFVVEDGNGNTFYTRQGSFQRNGEGFVVTHEGEFLLGDGGRVELGDDVRTLSVDEAGQVIVNGEAVATLQVVQFANPTYLRHEGRSLLSATPESGAAEAVDGPSVRGGMIERSNVEVVLEMVRMIEAQRCYEGAAKAVTSQDELTSRLFTSVGKPS